jgi:peptidyl-prolyl cis-trans isomerase C
MFLSLVICVVAAQSCKLLFKSEFAELKPSDLNALVETLPDMQKRRFAESEAMRKQTITQYKQAFSLAQAAEDEGLHKTDKFTKRMVITTEQLLASEFTKRNPDVTVAQEEWETYFNAHKAQFEADFQLVNEGRKQAVPDEMKEQQRAMWGKLKVRAQKARQSGIDKDPAFLVMLKFTKADVLANLYAQFLEDKNKLTDAERKKYLAEHPEADLDKLKEKAQGLLDRLKKGDSFEKIADEFNEDGTKGRGGDLDWFSKGMMDDDFEKAAFALQKGSYTNELVKSRFGFHIIRLDDRRMAAPTPTPATPPNPAATPAEAKPAEPKEEVRARHIYVSTQEAESFEGRLIQEKIKRAMEDASLKYPVNAPADFVVNVPGRDPNRVPGLGGGQSGTMRGIQPGENR